MQLTYLSKLITFLKVYGNKNVWDLKTWKSECGSTIYYVQTSNRFYKNFNIQIQCSKTEKWFMTLGWWIKHNPKKTATNHILLKVHNQTVNFTPWESNIPPGNVLENKTNKLI